MKREQITSLNEDIEILSVSNYEIDYSPEYDNEDEEEGIQLLLNQST